MSQVTVSQLAEVLGVSADRLLAQFKEAGISIGAADAEVTNDDKKKLLAFLRTAHGKSEGRDVAEAPRKVTLKRKTVSELKVPTAGAGRVRGRGPAPSRTVNVEVRKRRTYVKRGEIQETQVDDAEREAALKALEESRRAREEAEAAEREREQQRRAEQEERDKEVAEAREIEQVELERRRAEEDKMREAEEQARQDAEVRARVVAEAARLEAAREAKKVREREEEARRAGRGKAAKDGRTRYGREELHVAAKSKRRKPKRKGAQSTSGGGEHGFQMPTQPVRRELEIPDTITVGELAKLMAVKAGELIKALMNMGSM
ncbi:MAG: translation initiation factor IF-2, partial [Gammaproteobacteria bacterium HGW-Gammaproteobacteria-8]